MPITITIEAATVSEARQLVADLASVMPGVSDEQFPTDTKFSTIAEPVRPAETPKDEPEPEKEEAGPVETEAEAETVKIAPEDLRAEVSRITKEDPKKKSAVKELLQKYGAENISSIPEKDRPAFLADLKKL